MLPVYAARPVLDPYTPGWFMQEHQAIQRVLAAVEDVAIETVSPPLAYDPDTRTLSLTTSGGGATGSHRTTDVSVNTGIYTSTGLTFPVAVGDSRSARWVLWLGTSAGATGGITVQATYPAVGRARGIALGIRAGFVLGSVVASGSPLLLSSWANADFSASDGWVVVDASFDHFTANGVVDLQFHNAAGGETAIVRRNSSLVVIPT